MDLEESCLELDELEALRLADYEGLYHEEAAGRMNISRATAFLAAPGTRLWRQFWKVRP
jgi:predicted DNA-binding protein (UPF0251 family)